MLPARCNLGPCGGSETAGSTIISITDQAAAANVGQNTDYLVLFICMGERHFVLRHETRKQGLVVCLERERLVVRFFVLSLCKPLLVLVSSFRSDGLGYLSRFEPCRKVRGNAASAIRAVRRIAFRTQFRSHSIVRLSGSKTSISAMPIADRASVATA